MFVIVCDKEHLALRKKFRVTKKFLITKFDCIIKEVSKYILKTYIISCTSESFLHLTLKLFKLAALRKFVAGTGYLFTYSKLKRQHLELKKM